MGPLGRATLGGLLGVLWIAACGTQDESVFDGGEPPATTPPGTTPTEPGFELDAGPGATGDAAFTLVLSPQNPTITVTSGQPVPTVTFTATVNGGQVNASYTLDRGELATVGTATGLFTPSGRFGGRVKVTASYGGRIASTEVIVKLAVVQNGAEPATLPDGGVPEGGAPDGGGAGGNGGVGGEGEGAAVDGATRAVLDGAPQTATGLAWLYPYDKTVWPRGLLAPLLQWAPGVQADFDAVKIELREDDYTYVGTFAKTRAPFERHPIPQAAWRALATSNRGEEVTVSLTFAKGGVAYGPIVEKWKIASAPLKGTVYYNSYGTRLARNFTGAIGGDGRFGGATLGIRGGSTDPTLVAGGNGDQEYCRVCHSVAAGGSKLITQRNTGGQRKFSAYDLATGQETPLTPEGDTGRQYSWPAITSDGTVFLSDSSPMDGSSATPNRLFRMPSGAAAAEPQEITTNWPAGFRAAMPVFSPDTKRLAFNAYGGSPAADGRSIGVMTYDPATNQFGAPAAVHTPAAGTAVWPSFLPTSAGVVFQLETRYNTRDFGGTRSDADVAPPDARASRGTRGELWWVDVATKQAARLDRLNGLGYLPAGPNAHDDDATLNYEPTVNPVPSGGYAWVVFTSRRLYGNVATINPFHSDPRYVDLTSTPTPKKLWVAAVDLNAPPGTDPSHPAFYLPAQELLAGNSRGYWVVDPCKANATSCETGDECCGGYCRPAPDGSLQCLDRPPVCAQEFERCTTDGDCCSPTQKCVNQRCAQTSPGPR